MLRYACALLCAFLVISSLDPVLAKRSFGSGRHSYPRSGGLSGGGSRHSYPTSGGLSGGSHGYPPSGGLSGGGRGYPSSGGQSHAYPSSGTQNHGYPSSGTQNHGYPSSGTQNHGYPSSGGHGYPASGGLSGNSPSRTPQYQYSPPQQIHYTPTHGGAPVSYPVYHGTPPTYVYQYKDSGSKYGTLLAGLGLLNLGVLAGGLYAHSQSGHSGGSSNNYKAQPGEFCKFAIKKDNGDYEETKIDCHLISSFILEEQAKAQNGTANSTVTTTTVTNVTVVNTTNAMPEVGPAVQTGVETNFTVFDNGTLVPVNTTMEIVNTTTDASNTTDNNPMTSSSTITTTTTNTTTTLTNALDVKGAPVQVTPGMQCYVMRFTPTSKMKKTISCGLLQTYADQSLKAAPLTKSSVDRITVVPTFTTLALLCAFALS